MRRNAYVSFTPHTLIFQAEDIKGQTITVPACTGVLPSAAQAPCPGFRHDPAEDWDGNRFCLCGRMEQNHPRAEWGQK